MQCRRAPPPPCAVDGKRRVWSAQRDQEPRRSGVAALNACSMQKTHLQLASTMGRPPLDERRRCQSALVHSALRRASSLAPLHSPAMRGGDSLLMQL